MHHKFLPAFPLYKTNVESNLWESLLPFNLLFSILHLIFIYLCSKRADAAVYKYTNTVDIELVKTLLSLHLPSGTQCLQDKNFTSLPSLYLFLCSHALIWLDWTWRHVAVILMLYWVGCHDAIDVLVDHVFVTWITNSTLTCSFFSNLIM